jgi:putative hydrolase of the HAD superfamily
MVIQTLAGGDATGAPAQSDDSRIGERAPDWAQIDSVLLDMDGTVLDLAFDNHFWNELLPQRYAAHHGLSLADARARLRPKFDTSRGTLAWYCLDHWSRETALDIAALKYEARHRIAPLPGAALFLAAVRASGRPLWLVTNAHPRALEIKLEVTGLAPQFDRALSTHAFGAPKEDPEFWHRLVAAHPFDPARTLFVDDTLAILRAARAHGIAHPVAVRRPDSSQPLREIDEFYAVESLIELLPLNG